jgi:LPLT family lysophospholipid transporter-like MFS transporter
MKPSKNYPLLLIGQFLGAFGDNFLLAGILAPLTFLKNAGTITEQQVNGTNTLYSVVFFLPFILLAPLAGFVNDKMPKTTWLLGGNLVKILGVVVGFIGVIRHVGDHAGAEIWQAVGYTVVGIGACLYSPAKYGALPEVVPAEKLVKANGMVEMLTLVAILGGLGGGAVMYDRFRLLYGPTQALIVCYGGALACYVLAAVLNGMMSPTPCNPAARIGDSVQAFFRHLGALATHRRVGRILLGCGLFWLAGAFMRTNLHAWGLSIFEGSGMAREKITNERLALLKVGLVLGIVAGSVLAGRLHRIGDLSKQWLYALGLAGGVALLGVLPGSAGFYVIVPALCLSGVMAGLLVVPFNAALQNETDHSALGKTIAVQNVVDYAGMLLGAGLLGAMTKLDWSAHTCFLGLAGVIVLLTLGMKLSAKAGDGAPARA